MTKSNGIKSLKQAAKLLNKHSPDGESLAYINPEEAKLLRASGGSGIMTVSGVPSYDHAWWHTALQWAGDKVVEYAPKVYEWLGYGDQEVDDPDKPGEKKTVPGRSIVQDAMSVWAALRAKKEQEGLNAAEMEQFNKLNEQLSAAKTEFDVSTDFVPLRHGEVYIYKIIQPSRIIQKAARICEPKKVAHVSMQPEAA